MIDRLKTTDKLINETSRVLNNKKDILTSMGVYFDYKIQKIDIESNSSLELSKVSVIIETTIDFTTIPFWVDIVAKLTTLGYIFETCSEKTTKQNRKSVKICTLYFTQTKDKMVDTIGEFIIDSKKNLENKLFHFIDLIKKKKD